MKKVLLILLTFISLTSFAQLQVKEGSFKHIPNAIMNDKYDHLDGNDLPMALIKISTENIPEQERLRLKFSGNLATQITKTPKTGQIWIYISAENATFINIMHPDYGTYKYHLPEKLCDFCTYEMVLQYVPIVNLIEETTKSQNNFLTITCDQNEAAIYIDDEYVGDKDGYKSLPIGSTHTWKIECDLYHTESGNVTITESQLIINKNLRPAYGFINVKTTPENGAIVYINNKRVGETPYKSNKLASGSYKVRVVKEMYKTSEQTFVVSDGKTTDAVLNMMANYVNVTINTNSQSEIYVDNDFKGYGKWTGKLSDGSHTIEARKASHTSTYKEVNLVFGKNEIINLEAPKPIYGYLEISSSPILADIYIDGKHYGQTPKVINNLLIGEHELKLTKQNCAEIKKNIVIEEGLSLAIDEDMEERYVIRDDYKTIYYKDIKEAETKLLEYYEERKQANLADDLAEYSYNEYFPYQMFMDLIKNDKRAIDYKFNFDEIITVSSDDNNIKLYKWYIMGGSMNPGLCNGFLCVRNDNEYNLYTSSQDDFDGYYSLPISLYANKIKEVETYDGKKVYLVFSRVSEVVSYVIDSEKGVVEYPFFTINNKMENIMEFYYFPILNDYYTINHIGIDYNTNGDIWVSLPNGYKEIHHFDGYKYELKEVVYNERIPLYENLRNFKSNVVILDFSPFVIRIDEMPNGNYRYASWHEKEMSEKPNLVINNSLCEKKVEEVDYGMYSEKIEYTFTNGEYQYIVSYYMTQYSSFIEERPMNLIVKCNGKTIKTITKESK